MARIRSVHPGLFTDEAFASASMAARLLLIGIWTEAWDDGVFEWKPLTLKMRIFPAEGNIDVGALLAELEGLDILKSFDVGGRRLGAIRNFGKFQNPKKPNSSKALPVSLHAYVCFKKAEDGTDAASVPTQALTGSEPIRNQFGNSSPDGEGEGKGEGEERDNSLPAQQPIAASAPAAPLRRSELDRIENALRQAAKTENSPSPGLASLAPILGLLDQGADFEAEILPAIRAKPNAKARSWDYFVPQIQEFRARRRAAANAPFPAVDTRSGAGPPPSDPILDAARRRLARATPDAETSTTSAYDQLPYSGQTIDGKAIR